MFSINCRGKLWRSELPVVMGIINTTPDSFYADSRSASIDAALERAAGMINDGASIIDVGGQSTRPGSRILSADEEAERVVPVIEELHANFPDVLLSVDTYHAAVAGWAAEAGVHIINDVSGGDMDPEMLATVAALKLPYVCMHMQGTQTNMQDNPVYEDVTRDVLDFFIKRKAACTEAGIEDVIIDPGFGFGKTVEHNYALLNNLEVFGMLNAPLLLGVSRKSMICRPLDITPAKALNGTTVLHTIGLMKGAAILRAHDVKEAMECVRLWSLTQSSGN